MEMRFSAIHNSPNRSVGFTLVEALITLGIIAILTGLLLPAVQNARERARCLACVSNLRQLGEACNAFVATHGRFPSPTGADYWTISAQARLLPYLGYEELHAMIDFQTRPQDALNTTATYVRVSVFLCPSDSTYKLGSVPGNNYRMNGGTSGDWFYLPSKPSSGNGIFDAWPTGARPSDITDGLSRTALMSERVVGSQLPPATRQRDMLIVRDLPAQTPEHIRRGCERLSGEPAVRIGRTWIAGHPHTTWYNHVGRPNDPVVDCRNHFRAPYVGKYSARSLHPGLVNLLFADGSVHGITDTIDLNVWVAYGSRNGGEL